MEYQSLYRKYRPKNLSEVRGQTHIVSLLSNIVRTGAVSHAYLFIGGRGTGKTSVARIFASSIGIAPVDITEIDAASNRGIDEIRALKESVHTRGFESDKKMYIIDEVHMLTTQAFNALLKTLEEPPEHVVFVLATTDADKIPATILSRCQVLQFKKPTEEILETLVVDIAKQESLTLGEGVARAIAMLGEGSYRDTLSHLDMLRSSVSSASITRGDIEQISGVPKTETVLSFVELLTKKDGQVAAMKLLRDLLASGYDARMIMKMITSFVRTALLTRLDPSSKEGFQKEFSADVLDRLIQLSLSTDKPLTSKTLVECLRAGDALERSIFVPEAHLELFVYNIFETK